MQSATNLVVTLTVSQLEQLMEDAVARGVARVTSPEPLEYLTRAQVAQLIGVCGATIDTYVSAHGLPASKLGNEWRFARAEVVRWIASQRPARKVS
jgi:excisionase family DNA binding protein